MNDKNKQLALSLVENKLDSNPSMTYAQIEKRTGYSRRQLLRFAKNLKTSDKETMLRHGNAGKRPAVSATTDEIRFLNDFKKLHPETTIAEFKAIYQKEVIENPDYEEAVKKYNLKARSYSFFQRFYQDYHYQSPAGNSAEEDILQRIPNDLREYGTCVCISALSQSWMLTEQTCCLHLMYDEVTNSLLCGCFSPREDENSYLALLKNLFIQNGIPENLIFIIKEPSIRKNLRCKLERICERFGMELLIIPCDRQAYGTDEAFQQVKWLLKKEPLPLSSSSYENINRYFNEAFIPVYNRCYARPALADNSFVPLPDNVELPCLIMNFVRKTDHFGRFAFRGQHYDLYDEFGMVSLTDTEIILKEDVFANTLTIYYGEQKLYPVLCVGVSQ